MDFYFSLTCDFKLYLFFHEWVIYLGYLFIVYIYSQNRCVDCINITTHLELDCRCPRHERNDTGMSNDLGVEPW